MLLNCMYNKSDFRDVTRADAHAALDTDRNNAVNSPGSMLSCQRGAVISVLLNCSGNGTFLKLLKT